MIGLDVPRFLGGLSPLTIFLIVASMTTLTIWLAWIILRMQGITRAKAPIDLIKS